MSDWLSLAQLTQLIELVIALTVLEGVALVLYHRATGRGPAPRNFLLNLVSGLYLMLALHSAMTQTGWMLIALWLLASGLAHATDLWLRWKPQGTNPTNSG